MSISVLTNFIALRLGGRLRNTASQLGDTYNRLSSGSRLSRGADDPAGLALADKLRSDSRTMTMALRNANDALSLTNLADAGLEAITNILTRMSELAVQGSSSTYSLAQRSAMQLEFSALGSEVDRVASTTVFNSIKLLSASSTLVAQVGIKGDTSSILTLPSAVATLATLGIGDGTRLTYSLSDISTTYAVSASQNAYSALQTALDTVLVQRGTIGATSSRLSTAISALGVARDTYTLAESEIRDTDIAADSTALVRLQVLQEAQSSLLAQANQLPSMVLKLLEK